MSESNLTERELRTVLEAREQSRAEAHEWERHSQRMKAIHSVKENNSVDEFHRRSPEIESEPLRGKAFRANG